MSKSINQKRKLICLLKILWEHTDDTHGLTLSEITDFLAEYGIEAERKSLYDDFECLRLEGFDIQKRKIIKTYYHLASRSFELPELKLLVDSVQSSKFITHKKSNQLIRKIESLASRHEASVLQRQVFVANRIKTMNESIYYTVDYIHEAITGNCKISFKYFEWDENKQKRLRKNGDFYIVSPWALTWDDENYYLVGFDSESEKIKHYRVDKMLELSVLSEPREGTAHFKNFDTAVYSKKTFGMFGGTEERVVLNCVNSLAGVIIDRFGQDISMRKVDDLHFETAVSAAVSPMFLSWVVNFGGGIKIISPQSVIDQLKDLVAKATEIYE